MLVTEEVLFWGTGTKFDVYTPRWADSYLSSDLISDLITADPGVDYIRSLGIHIYSLSRDPNWLPRFCFEIPPEGGEQNSPDPHESDLQTDVIFHPNYHA